MLALYLINQKLNTPESCYIYLLSAMKLLLYSYVKGWWAIWARSSKKSLYIYNVQQRRLQCKGQCNIKAILHYDVFIGQSVNGATDQDYSNKLCQIIWIFLLPSLHQTTIHRYFNEKYIYCIYIFCSSLLKASWYNNNVCMSPGWNWVCLDFGYLLFYNIISLIKIDYLDNMIPCCDSVYFCFFLALL